MRTLAQKPEAAQQTPSTLPGRAPSGRSGEERSFLSLHRPPQAGAEGPGTKPAVTPPVRLGHDFGRIAVLAPWPGRAQPRLTISTPGDIYEQEAAGAAERVMHMPEPQAQRVDPPEREAQKDQADQGDSPIRRMAVSDPGEAEAPQPIGQVLRSGGQPLAQELRTFFEPRFGHDFSQVRIHTGQEAAQTARALSASAYTVGRHIVFGAGQFRPATPAGRRLLAHELAHVIQPSTPGSPLPIRRQYGELPPGGVPLPTDEPSEAMPGTGTVCPCNPFPSREEAIRDRDARWPSMRSDIDTVAGPDVADIYDVFVHGGSPSVRDLPAAARRAFAESPTSVGAAGYLRSALMNSMLEQPIELPYGRRSMQHVPMTERLSSEIAQLEAPGSRFRMNFTEIGSVPGTLAGDIGPTDHRQASVEVDVRRISETEVRVQPRITFTVRDIVDFCPGDCGSGMEREYTVPMSRWEATDIAGDVPFRVVYTMELDPFTVPYIAQPMSNERLISEIMQRYVYIVQESRRAGGNIEELATLAGEIGRFVHTYIANVMRESGIERPAARERLREEILADGRASPEAVENIFRFAEVAGASPARSTGGRRER